MAERHMHIPPPEEWDKYTDEELDKISRSRPIEVVTDYPKGVDGGDPDYLYAIRRKSDGYYLRDYMEMYPHYKWTPSAEDGVLWEDWENLVTNWMANEYLDIIDDNRDYAPVEGYEIVRRLYMEGD